MRRPEWVRGRRPTIVILGGWFSRAAEIFIRVGIIVMGLVLLIIGSWGFGLGIHIRMDSPLIDAYPYTQLRPVPIAPDEQHVKFASKESIGRHIARSHTISSILYRSTMEKFKAVEDHPSEVISSSGSTLRNLFLATDSGWSTLLYVPASGVLTFSVVDPSFSRLRVCRYQQYSAQIKPMLDPRWETESDPSTGLPMGIPGTTDWKITTIHIMAGRCSYVAGASSKKIVALCYETIKDQSKVIMLRLYRVDDGFKFPKYDPSVENGSKKMISCGESCTELRLQGSLSFRTAEWAFDNSCLLYGRQDDVVEFRSLCFFDSPDGVYYGNSGIVGPKQSFSKSSFVILVDVPQTDYEKPHSILGVRVSNQSSLSMDAIHNRFNSSRNIRQTVPTNTASLWEQSPPEASHWDIKEDISSIPADDVYLYERQLKASSPEGNYFALTLVTDAVVVYDIAELIKKDGSYVPMQIFPTPLQRSMTWTVTPPGLRQTLLNYWYGTTGDSRQSSYLRKHQRAELSNNGEYLSLITKQAMFVFKRGLCISRYLRLLLLLELCDEDEVVPDTCWIPYWSLHRDRTRIGLGRNLDIYETTFMLSDDGKKTFVGVLFEEGVFATYLLEGGDDTSDEPSIVNWTVVSYVARCLFAFVITKYFSSVVDPVVFYFVMFLVLFVVCFFFFFFNYSSTPMKECPPQQFLQRKFSPIDEYT